MTTKRDVVELLLKQAQEPGVVGCPATMMRHLCERWLAVEDAATGECMEVGDDEEGQPRVLVHSTRDELRWGPSLVFKRVRIVPEGGGDGR